LHCPFQEEIGRNGKSMIFLLHSNISFPYNHVCEGDVLNVHHVKFVSKIKIFVAWCGDACLLCQVFTSQKAEVVGSQVHPWKKR
jgi:hypothetical protein